MINYHKWFLLSITFYNFIILLSFLMSRLIFFHNIFFRLLFADFCLLLPVCGMFCIYIKTDGNILFDQLHAVLPANPVAV